MKKFMDSEIDNVVARLLKKGLDSNSFISKEVRECLNSLCQNLNEGKVISCLLGHSNQKALPIKLNVVQCFEVLIEKCQSRLTQLKEYERFLQVLCNFTQDQAVEVRNISKRALNTLSKSMMHRSELESQIKRLFSEAIS